MLLFKKENLHGDLLIAKHEEKDEEIFHFLFRLRV